MVHSHNSQNLQIKIYWQKQGPCHILRSRGGISLKLSLASDPNKKGLLMTYFFVSCWYQRKRFIVCEIQMGHIVINQYLRSRAISCVGFSFISCMELKTHWGRQFPQAASSIIRTKLHDRLTWQLKTIVKRVWKKNKKTIVI